MKRQELNESFESKKGGIIKRFGATIAALSSYVTPVVATVGGVLVLGETFTGVMLAGIGLIIAGIGLINRRAARQPSLM